MTYNIEDASQKMPAIMISSTEFGMTLIALQCSNNHPDLVLEGPKAFLLNSFHLHSANTL